MLFVIIFYLGRKNNNNGKNKVKIKLNVCQQFSYNFKDMKRTLLTALAITTAFIAGYAVKSINIHQPANGRVTSIGGIFFKCKDPKAVREWYKAHLGFEVNSYGAVFEWRHGGDSAQKGFTQWSPFNEKTKYFEPSTKEFMINFRVTNLEALMAQLKLDGVTVVDKIESASYGKFVHIMDLEGNKIELWEPNDVVYEKMGAEMKAKTIK